MLKGFFSHKNLPRLSLIVILLTCIYSLWYFDPWTKNEDGKRGVIKWDVITYYSYLPAAIVHGDLRLDFLDEGKIVNDNKFWTVHMDNGNRLIITSMGLSFMYAPFFLIAHGLAPLLGQENDGFSNVYQFMLVLGGFLYAFTALILLARFLRRYFNPLITAVTILAVGLGTNLFFYMTLEAAMPHSHNFFLITIFLLMVIRWYNRPNWGNAFLLGALFGLIVLVRPTNILLFLFLLLYGVTSWGSFRERILFYLNRWYLVLGMILLFLVPWIPQFIYWKEITGQWMYFTYGEKGASFFFGQPQILKSLFHVRKGWLIYTPVMAFALAGIPLLYKRHREWLWPMILYVATMIYVQSSWWCWWFGGGWGLRAYISMYPLLAFPMAVFLETLSRKRRLTSYLAAVSAMVLLVAYQIFQTRQFTTSAIHYSGTTWQSYCENFLHSHPTKQSWKMLEVPDFNLARLGIHVSYPTSEDKEAWRSMDQKEARDKIRRQIRSDEKLVRQIERYAERSEIPADSAMVEVVDRMYFRKSN